MKTIKSLLIIALIPMILCCSCTYSTEVVATTTPQPTTIATPTATKVVIDDKQAIAIAREAAKEYLGYDETKLATNSEIQALNNEDFESLKGELKYIDDFDTITPMVVKHYYKNRHTWEVKFYPILNTKCNTWCVGECRY